MTPQTIEPSAPQRIFHALDVDHPSKAIDIVKRLAHYDIGFKIGRLLTDRTFAVNFSPAGRPIRQEFNERLDELGELIGNQAFLDVKEHDIKNTVLQSLTGLSLAEARVINVHASASMAALESVSALETKAVKAGVTALTDMTPADCKRVFGTSNVRVVVARLSQGLIDANFDAVICAPGELQYLKGKGIIPRLQAICPNVYPDWMTRSDQSVDRGSTPCGAIHAGASFEVIGRSISSPPEEFRYPDGRLLKIGSPERATELIIEEIEEALKTV